MMSKRIQKPDDKDLEIIMGNLLRYGVLLSAIIVLTGAIIYLKQHAYNEPQYTNFEGEPKRLTEFRSIWQTALQGRGRSVIQLGLLFLIATPITRIIFSIAGFLLEKDVLYTVLTLIVLTIVLFGFL
jgi:uncharacterized membrane protein